MLLHIYGLSGVVFEQECSVNYDMGFYFRIKDDIKVTESLPTIRTRKGQMVYSLVTKGMYVRCVDEFLFKQMLEYPGLDHFRKVFSEKRELTYSQCNIVYNYYIISLKLSIVFLVFKEMVNYLDKKPLKCTGWDYAPWFNIQKNE